MNRVFQIDYRSYMAGASLIVLSLLSAKAAAQQAPVAQPAPNQVASTTGSAVDSPDSNGAIVVTARRRDESLFKVPVAVSVVSGDTLIKQGIRTEADLQTSVPGLLVPAGFGGNDLNYSIRGQTIDSFSGSAPAVVPYLDEVEIGGGEASTFFDFESVQVLKGPQGTLFGKNTTGGAILFTTVKPGDKLAGYVDVLTGNFGKQQVQAAVTLPLSPIATLRLAGNFSDGGGFVTNHGYYTGLLPSAVPGAPPPGTFVPQNNTLGGNRNESFRGTLVLKPTDWLTNTTVVQHSINNGTSVPSVTANYDSNPAHAAAALILPFLAGQSGPFAGIPQYVAYQNTHFQDVYTAGSWRNVNSGLFVINTTEVKINDDTKIKNIAGWNRFTKDNQGDYTGTPWHIFENPNIGPGEILDRRAFSEELQLQGKILGGKLNYTLGGFYSNSYDFNSNNFIIFDAIPIVNNGGLQTKSYAGFGQATYNITDQLHFTAGGRYTDSKVNLNQLAGGEFAPGGTAFTPSLQQAQAVSFKKPSWTFSLDDQVTRELLLYVTQRGSFRSGGLNFNAPPNPGVAAQAGNTFLPETLKDVELGAKFNGRLGDSPFTASLDVYQQWINNVQKSQNVSDPGPVTLTINIPKAKVKGVEATFSLRPASWIDLGGQISYSKSDYTDNLVNLLGISYHFGPVSDAPQVSGAAYVNLTKALNDGSSIELHSDMFFESQYFYSNTDDTISPNTNIPGYALVNGRLSWNKIEGTRLNASIFAKNLLDKKYYAGGISSIQADGADVRTFGQPRTYGLELRYSF